MEHWSLSGKTALVSGGTRGIGAATALELAGLGAEVLVVGRDPAGVEALVARGPRLHGLAADVSHAAGRAAILERIGRDWGRLDVLVNNAGTNLRQATLEYTPDQWRGLMATNLESAFELTRGAHPLLAAARGAIVNVGSVAGARAVLTGAPYALSKAALEQLTRYLAVEWAPQGIRVNAVLPWYTRTPLAAPVLGDAARLEQILARTPLGRIAEPEEVARAIAFLCLPAASFVTGACLPVDGGFLAKGL